MPKTTSRNKWLKRIVFGGLVKMPAEIGPQITRINGRKKAQKAQKCPQNEKLYRGRYVEPERISSEEANTSYKGI